MSLVIDDEVYSSYEFQQYLLILDEVAALCFAKQELEKERKRALLASASIPYKEWYRQYLETPEWESVPRRRKRVSAVGACYATAPMALKRTTVHMIALATSSQTI
jgi:hypothetical protein